MVWYNKWDGLKVLKQTREKKKKNRCLQSYKWESQYGREQPGGEVSMEAGGFGALNVTRNWIDLTVENMSRI